MRTVSLLAVLAVVACGKRPDPELATKELQQSGPTTNPGDPKEFLDESLIPDSGALFQFDAGVCCPVDFVVAALQPEETAAELELHLERRRVPMTKTAGQWRTTACVLLDPQRYHYRIGIDFAGADAGLFWLERVNPGAPVSQGLTGLQNDFDPNGANTCAQLDAGVHGVDPRDGG